MGVLSFLFENPLMVAGILGLATVLVYLSSENRYMRQKTQEIKKSVMRGWGVFLLLIAVVSLFTTSWSFVLENAKIVPYMPTGYVTLEQASRLCGKEAFQGCNIMNYGYWGLVGLIFLGIALIIVGSIKMRKRIQQAKTESKEEKAQEKEK